MKVNQKNLANSSVDSVLTGVGFVAEGFIANQTVNILPASIQKFQGPIHTLLGIFGMTAVKDKNAKAALKGIAVGGVIRSVKTFAPDGIRQTLALNGIGTSDEDFFIGDEEMIDEDIFVEDLEDTVPSLVGTGEMSSNLSLV